MSEKKQLSESAHRARRRSPVFIDEPIQWHLRTEKHNRCPWCGLATLARRGSRKRNCTNAVCAITIEIPMSATEWLKKKLDFEQINYNRTALFRPFVLDEHYTLEEAWVRSETGRASLFFSPDALLVANEIFWHRDGLLPENLSGQRCVAAGSPYWRLIAGLRNQDMWTPESPLNAMEVIARAVSDEPTFCIMSP